MRHTLSKRFFVLTIGIAVGTSHMLAVIGMLMSKYKVSPLVPLSLLPMSCAGLVLALLVYRAWESIQDGHARMTPSSSVMRLLIPVYNVYWIFQVWWGFAKDYNEYLDRHDLSVSKISEGIFLAFASWNLAVAAFGALTQVSHSSLLLEGGLFVLAGFLGIGHTVLAVLMARDTCDAVNSLAATTTV